MRGRVSHGHRHSPPEVYSTEQVLHSTAMCGSSRRKLRVLPELWLDYLGLSPPEEPKPPRAVHEVVRVPVDEEGRQMEAP